MGNYKTKDFKSLDAKNINSKCYLYPFFVIYLS